MDSAQEIELNGMRYHKQTDDLTVRGDSAIQQYYEGTTVFVTGGSGFLGKQLVEKLLRSCAIKRIYLLTRSKNGKTVQERLKQILEEPVFDRLRDKQPEFSKKVIPVEGDVADIKLGLSERDWTVLAEEVEIIFHEAATIKLEEPLVKAVITNVRGTREVLTLARQCEKLKNFIHVSTLFCHAIKETVNTDVNEQFYSTPMPPHTIIELAENLDKSIMESITKDLTKGWPNTYTFTKALAEELLRTTAGDLPVCIMRPSVVLPAYFEPNPGWLDTHAVVGPIGIFLGSALGILRVFHTDVNATIATAPVDFVNNATIAAAWDSTERKRSGETGIPLNNLRRNLRFGLIGETLKKYRHKWAVKSAVWYIKTIETKSKLRYLILSWFYHYIPGYCIDFLCKISGFKLHKRMPSLVSFYRMVDKLACIYNFFFSNYWNFTENNVTAMLGRMSDADKQIFNCCLSNVDDVEHILTWTVGLRRYILKEGLTGTAEAIKKQKVFYALRFFALPMYIYSLWYVFSSVLMSFKKTMTYLMKLKRNVK